MLTQVPRIRAYSGHLHSKTHSQTRASAAPAKGNQPKGPLSAAALLPRGEIFTANYQEHHEAQERHHGHQFVHGSVADNRHQHP